VFTLKDDGQWHFSILVSHLVCIFVVFSTVSLHCVCDLHYSYLFLTRYMLFHFIFYILQRCFVELRAGSPCCRK